MKAKLFVCVLVGCLVALTFFPLVQADSNLTPAIHKISEEDLENGIYSRDIVYAGQSILTVEMDTNSGEERQTSFPGISFGPIDVRIQITTHHGGEVLIYIFIDGILKIVIILDFIPWFIHIIPQQ